MDSNGPFCVLGGAGLVGYQVCRRLLAEDGTRTLFVVSLDRAEVSEAVGRLRREFPEASVSGRYGDVFSRGALRDVEAPAEAPVRDRNDPNARRELLADIYESFEEARRHSSLASFLVEARPAAVVDCINTATAISYRDVPSAAKRIMAELGLREGARKAGEARVHDDVLDLLASIEVPQLVLHVRLLHAALKEAGTAIYLKVGTTGTGGMGLNIPYTHGEDKPSPTLMAKTAVAFAHTGLLFLLARTEGGPVVKELKPAAMIGYREVAVREVPGHVWRRRGDRFHKERAQARPLFRARRCDLTEPLDTTPDAQGFEPRSGPSGEPRTIRLACVNTGENGWFARGEFEAITALGQMEMITPEEIAHCVVQELAGRSTGRDILAAVDGAVLAPTYKGGLIRQVAVDRLTRLDCGAENTVPSIALGDLGPPQLSKYLFELSFLQARYETLEAAVQGLRSEGASAELEALVEERPDLRDTVVSVGIPILLSDGRTILRGPEIKIPGYDPTRTTRRLSPEEIDACAARGWVDFRKESLLRWAQRLQDVLDSRRGGSAGASDAMSHDTYGRDDFRIGEVVAWVFANEPEFRGFRIK